MRIIGLDYITKLISGGDFEAKAVLSRHGAIFFPVDQQHRDQKAPGISYDDNHRGTALAAMIRPGRIEIRYHSRFGDSDVARIVAALAEVDGLSFLANCHATYQGRRLQIRSGHQ